jgi:5-methylcytosine-specific restriction protein B
MSPSDPQRARDELAKHLDSIDRSAPSVTKYNAFSAWLAALAGLQASDVYTSTISKPGNVVVRFKQSGKRPKLGVAVVESPDHVEGSITAGGPFVGPGRIMQAMAFCARPPGEPWNIVAVLEQGRDIADRLLESFPQLELRAPDEGDPPALPLLDRGEPDAPEALDAIELLSDDQRQQIADQLGADREWVDDLHWMLKDRRAIVLYGPPGTGKTFVARALSKALQPDSAKRRLVQLHPSYGYEDFFEGYRPRPSETGLSLVKTPGPLRELAAAAAADPAAPVVLLLDEMNRGNIPKVFGELYYALEYRDDAVGLMYSPDEQFRLPENLYVIGTMNTADRSIVSIDQALRRRFHFCGMFPGEPPVAGMLDRYLDRNAPHMKWVAKVLDLANERLGDRNVAIGPSHFMRPDLDPGVLRRIWNHSILPTLEDHFFGNAHRLEEFQLDVLEAAVRTGNDG